MKNAQVTNGSGGLKIEEDGANLFNESAWTEAGMKTLAGSTPGNYYVVYAGGTNAAQIYQPSGQPNYVALLYDENGIVQSNSNVIGLSTLGNPQYLLTSARFQSTLIKDATGSIIGIAFYQI